jgi:hypothetical protein
MYNLSKIAIGEKMTKNRPAVLSALLTFLVLILLAFFTVFLQMVALNGASERQGFTAMGISLACQSIAILLLGIFAAKATRFLITNVNWNNTLAVTVTVLVATVLGGTLSFLFSIIAIPIAGIP